MCPPSREFLNITRFSNLFITNTRVFFENIFLLFCGEYSRKLPCILPTLPSKQTSIQTCFADHAECFSKLLKFYLVKTFCEYVSKLLICLCRHDLDLTFKDFFPYVVVVDFYVYGSCMKNFSTTRIEDKLSQKILTS